VAGSFSPHIVVSMEAVVRTSTFALLVLATSLHAAAPATPDELFSTAAFWPVHLGFQPEQWKAMEPADSGRPFGGPGEGPGGFLTHLFLKDAQKEVSKTDFLAIPGNWFASWDSTKSGKLAEKDIADGIGKLLPGPRPGGPAREGRPPIGGNDEDRYPKVHASIDLAGASFADVQARYKGNATYMASRNQLKRSLKIDLNKFVKGQKIATVTELNLHSSVMDPSWMNEALSYELYREAGVPSPRTTYAQVWLRVPGQHDNQYLGLYNLVENVDKHFLDEHYASPGALFKPEHTELFADLGDDFSAYEKAYDPKTSVSTKQKERFIEFVNLLNKANDAEFAAKAAEYLDLDELARYFAVTVWIAAMDSPLAMDHNYYLYLDAQTMKFQIIPWDLDLAFGKFGGNGEDLSIEKPWRGNKKFLERLFSLESFKKPYLAYLAKYQDTIFKPGKVAARMQEIARAIRPAIAQESKEKLAQFDDLIAGKFPEVVPSGTAEARQNFRGPGGPMSGKPIGPFVEARSRSVADQLAGKPVQVPAANERRGGGFDPGRNIARSLTHSADSDNDGAVTQAELSALFEKWFDDWDIDKSGALSGEELRAGLGKSLMPPPFGGRPGTAPTQPPPRA
jgi:hypothetical protein